MRYALACLIGLVSGPADEPEVSPDVTTPPAAESFLILPLRVHLLQSDDLPELNCALADEDIHRIVAKVNRVWNVAGIHWGLESIVREPVADPDRFRDAKKQHVERPLPLSAFRTIRPEASRRFDGLHVYYIHDFSVNGVYMGSDYAVVQETARLREVEGGIDEPLPRVTAHELGHALGLPHRQDRTNLLASGTTGTKLNAKEVETARDRARKVPGALTRDALREAADRAEADDPARARTLRGWLAELPAAGGR